MASPVLEYPTRANEPSSPLTLEDGPDFARVVFPVEPAWNYLAVIAILAAIATFDAMIPVLGMAHWFSVTHHRLTVRDLTGISLGDSIYLAGRFAVDIAFWLVLAAYLFWRYRRFGRVPRTLTATPGGITYSRLGFFAMRQRFWPAEQITAVQLQPLWGNLSRTVTATDLCIRSGTGPLKTLRLVCADPSLPARIAARFNTLLAHQSTPER
jgi:hypothetical protein